MRPQAAVLDASTTAPWFLPDEASDVADEAYALMRRGALLLHAPGLWVWECANIVASSVKRRRLTPEDALLAWSAVESIRAQVKLAEPKPGHAGAALSLAMEHGLSVYDAAYLRLAASLNLPLLTLDKSLGRAALAVGVQALGMKDLA